MHEKKILLLAVVLFVAVTAGQGLLSAATLNTILHLEMDGDVQDPNGVIVDTATEVVANPDDPTVVYTYLSDSTGNTVPVTLRADEYGALPDLSTTAGVMYTNGKSSDALEIDEVMLAELGPGYTEQENYVFEAWVKPDYLNYPTSTDNTWGQIWVIRWGEILDWSVTPPVTTSGMAMGLTASAYQMRSGFADSGNVFTPSTEPDLVLSGTEFSHMAIVCTYDGTETCVDVYINAELKASGCGVSTAPTAFPEVLGIANHSFSASQNQIPGWYNGDINFNGGFSGWIDAVAVSTFTGNFDVGDFVLLDPQYCGDLGTEYLDADFNTDCIVNLEDFTYIASDWLLSGY